MRRKTITLLFKIADFDPINVKEVLLLYGRALEKQCPVLKRIMQGLYVAVMSLGRCARRKPR